MVFILGICFFEKIYCHPHTILQCQTLAKDYSTQ